MLLLASVSALLLLAAIVFVVGQALAYLHHHPELIAYDTPPSYQRCHLMLAQVIERYKQVESAIDPAVQFTWLSPNHTHYAVRREGVEERREAGSSSSTYHLGWDHIGGIGVRMQPGFKAVDDFDTLGESIATTGYTFHLLIVPVSGNTIDIALPTYGREDAVEFAASLLALARLHRKRINVFGFDKPPAPHRQTLHRT